MRYFTLLCLCASLFACNANQTSSNNHKVETKALLSVEKKPSVIMFYAQWCGYCKKMFPTFKALQEKYNKELNFFYIDIDTSRGKELAAQYRTKPGGIPDTQFYDAEGNLLDEKLGAMPPAVLIHKVESLIVPK